MQYSAYTELIQRLFAVSPFPRARNGLETVSALSQALGNPHSKFPVVHVAGTNGKGSVATKIAAGLQAGGYRTGLFTSPHLTCFRERIRVDGEKIPEEVVCRWIPRLFQLAEELGEDPSFFDYAALLAFAYFAEQAVDVAVIEVGLGGRLDATNVVNPELSVITSVSLDHTSVLGETEEEIAREKAGIIKPGRPVICGPCTPQSLLQEIGQRRGCEVIRLQGGFDDFDEENSAIAIEALKCLTQRFPRCSAEAAHAAHAPGRFEECVPGVFIDVAHNPGALKRLVQKVRRVPAGKVRVVLGLNKEKDLRGCLEALVPLDAKVHLVQPGQGRGAEVEGLAKLAAELSLDIAGKSRDTLAEVARALGLAKQNEELLVICGSFFLVEDALRAIDKHPPNSAMIG